MQASRKTEATTTTTIFSFRCGSEIAFAFLSRLRLITFVSRGRGREQKPKSQIKLVQAQFDKRSFQPIVVGLWSRLIVVDEDVDVAVSVDAVVVLAVVVVVGPQINFNNRIS